MTITGYRIVSNGPKFRVQRQETARKWFGLGKEESTWEDVRAWGFYGFGANYSPVEFNCLADAKAALETLQRTDQGWRVVP